MRRYKELGFLLITHHLDFSVRLVVLFYMRWTPPWLHVSFSPRLLSFSCQASAFGNQLFADPFAPLAPFEHAQPHSLFHQDDTIQSTEKKGITGINKAKN